MLFNSYEFLFLFAPVVFVVYWSLESQLARKWVSVLASYLFYGVWSVRFAGLMLATTSVDYFTARLIEDSQSPSARRRWLALSMVSNLGVLAIFKYYDFFAGSLNSALGGRWLPLLHVVLPIGISFYTFESMSYTIDVYRGKTRALRRFVDYAHFVTMFPRLVAGPIVRYSDLADQLRELPRRLDADRVLHALHFFTIGLAKKVIIADVIAAQLVDPLFAHAGTLQLSHAWAAALGYTAQLYFDFSGYSDMAVGLGALLGFQLPRNFNRPYAAANPSEFWRRWHISLSTWLRDYLFIPLGGSRGSRWGTARNLFLTMLLGGLWHGANWTFVAWGAYHGMALLLYHVGLWPRLPRVASIALNFLVVVAGWVMFRAASFGQAKQVYRAMLGMNGWGLSWVSHHLPVLVFLVAALGISFSVDTYDLAVPRRRTWAAAAAVVLVFCVTRLTVASPFLYFQF